MIILYTVIVFYDSHKLVAYVRKCLCVFVPFDWMRRTRVIHRCLKPRVREKLRMNFFNHLPTPLECTVKFLKNLASFFSRVDFCRLGQLCTYISLIFALTDLAIYRKCSINTTGSLKEKDSLTHAALPTCTGMPMRWRRNLVAHLLPLAVHSLTTVELNAVKIDYKWTMFIITKNNN